MIKRTIRLIICLALVVFSAIFAIYCIMYADKRLPLSIISVIGTGAILTKEIFKK